MQMRLTAVGPASTFAQIVLMRDRLASLYGGELRPTILRMRVLFARLRLASLLTLL